uniref:Uncharacterized protein n=1 Tax=Anguilla anguilla TaxID=7936 RepID=A0A0E9Q4G6_ANGAN
MFLFSLFFIFVLCIQVNMIFVWHFSLQVVMVSSQSQTNLSTNRMIWRII